jgi:hypothetical protein
LRGRGKAGEQAERQQRGWAEEEGRPATGRNARHARRIRGWRQSGKACGDGVKVQFDERAFPQGLKPAIIWHGSRTG